MVGWKFTPNLYWNSSQPLCRSLPPCPQRERSSVLWAVLHVRSPQRGWGSRWHSADKAQREVDGNIEWRCLWERWSTVRRQCDHLNTGMMSLSAVELLPWASLRKTFSNKVFGHLGCLEFGTFAVALLLLSLSRNVVSHLPGKLPHAKTL